MRIQQNVANDKPATTVFPSANVLFCFDLTYLATGLSKLNTVNIEFKKSTYLLYAYATSRLVFKSYKIC